MQSIEDLISICKNCATIHINATHAADLLFKLSTQNEWANQHRIYWIELCFHLKYLFKTIDLTNSLTVVYACV